MLKTLHHFTRSLFPFIEIILLSFILGIAVESSAFAIVAFLFLLVTVYIWPTLVRSVGWGIVSTLVLVHVIPNQAILFQIFVGILVGGIRYLLIKMQGK